MVVDRGLKARAYVLNFIYSGLSDGQVLLAVIRGLIWGHTANAFLPFVETFSAGVEMFQLLDPEQHVIVRRDLAESFERDMVFGHGRRDPSTRMVKCLFQ